AFAGGGPNPAGHPGGDSDNNDSTGGRLSLRLEPNEAWRIDLAAETSAREYTPSIFGAVDFNAAGNGPTGPGCNAPGFVRVAPAYTQTLCVPANTNFLANFNRDRYSAPVFGIGRVKDDTQAYRGRIAYRASDAATWTYIGGYRSYSGDDQNLYTLPVVYRRYWFLDDADTQSHELRFNGERGRWIYQFGAFYFKEEQNRESGLLVPIGGPNGTYISYFGRDLVSDSMSLFGQVDFAINDTLTAVGGLRYTENDREALYRNASPFGPMGPDPALFNAGPARKDFSTLRYLSTLNLNPPKEDELTWLAGLNYKPSDAALIYGKVSTGFKAGGFDSVGPYKPETNTAVEVGWKQSFGAGRRHQLNLSAFHYDYKDLQVSVLLDTSIGGQIFNAGKATIWGIEASGDFKVTERDRLHGSVNYLNAEYDQLLAQFNVFCVGCPLNGIGDLDPTTPGVQQPNFAGNRPPYSPEFVVTAGYDRVFPLGASGSLTAKIFSTYKSSYFTDFFNYRDSKQDSFVQTDLT
ncbi:MAG: TonB-dependent receptor, partial [Steroidobacteraceae bacterium]|nr:TonB-dependent receptor [Steroidobacteraceae bacterium]